MTTSCRAPNVWVRGYPPGCRHCADDLRPYDDEVFCPGERRGRNGSALMTTSCRPPEERVATDSSSCVYSSGRRSDQLQGCPTNTGLVRRANLNGVQSLDARPCTHSTPGPELASVQGAGSIRGGCVLEYPESLAPRLLASEARGSIAVNKAVKNVRSADYRLLYSPSESWCTRCELMSLSMPVGTQQGPTVPLRSSRRQNRAFPSRRFTLPAPVGALLGRAPGATITEAAHTGTDGRADCSAFGTSHNYAQTPSPLFPISRSSRQAIGPGWYRRVWFLHTSLSCIKTVTKLDVCVSPPSCRDEVRVERLRLRETSRAVPNPHSPEG
ncbi:hypothetical protein Bbelb_357980 [Branchiostoma belcheri]|nr:hypothetical protein Bbelb_357980 [Branchiostoma belcheri]